jgi:carbonic anhydrase/acetyltransferase-like protein (isoleucine patch superfamily)
MSFLKNLAWHIIWHYNSLRIGQLGANSNISPYVTLRGFTNNISIGHNVLVSPRV